MEGTKKKKYLCPVEYTMDTLGGKWKVQVIWQLRQGTKRFNQLQRIIQGISTKMLNQTLKELEEANIISRKVYAEVPPRVEYSITSTGEKLYPALDLMWSWGVAQENKK